MRLTAVIYELFDSDAQWLDDHPADPVHLIDREIHLRFADAPDSFISWDVSKRSELYEVTATPTPRFNGPFESRDMSQSALWSALINTDVELLPLGGYHFALEIRSKFAGVYCCARENGRWGMDTLEITADRPHFPRSALVGDWPLTAPSAAELTTLPRSALTAYLLRLARRSAWEYRTTHSYMAAVEDDEGPTGDAVDHCIAQIASALAADDADQLAVALEWLTPITVALRVHGAGQLHANACHSAILCALLDALQGGKLVNHIRVACDAFLKLEGFRDHSWSNEWRPSQNQRLAALRADFELLRESAAEHHWQDDTPVPETTFLTDPDEFEADPNA